MTITEENSLIYLFETKIGEAVSYVPKMCGAEKLRAVHFWNAVSEKLQIIVNESAADINAVAMQMDEHESEKVTLEMNNSNAVSTLPQPSSDFVIFTQNYEPSSGSDKDYQTVGIGNSQFMSSESFPTVSEAVSTCSASAVHHVNSTHSNITDPSVSIKSTPQQNFDATPANSSYGMTVANENIPCLKKDDMLKKIIIKETSNVYNPSEVDENCSFLVQSNVSSKKTCKLTESISKTPRKRTNSTKPLKLDDNTHSKDKLDCDRNDSFVTDESSEDSFDNYKSDFEAIESAGESDSNHTESIVSFVVSNTEEILTKNKIALNMEESNFPVSADDCDKKIPCDLDVADTDLTHAKSYSCAECSAQFQTKGNLIVHMRRHTGEKPFSCNKCRSQFTTRGNLKRHQRTHTGEKPFECNHCFSKFTEKKSLTVHMRRHTGEKPYQCNVCGKKFAQTGVLQSHMDMHLNQKSHLCEHCGKSFRQKSQLHIHKLRHDNIKKFACPSCEAKFLTKGDLERHMRIHTGERPFVCEICSKSFTRQQSLNEHMNRHYGIRPYVCKHCSRAFSEMSACYKHEKAHRKQKDKPPEPDDSQSCEVDESTSTNCTLTASASDPLARMMTLSGIF